MFPYREKIVTLCIDSFTMDKVFIHDKVFVPFIPYEKVSQIIDGVADRLNKDFCESQTQDQFIRRYDYFAGNNIILIISHNFDIFIIEMKVEPFGEE